MIVFLAAAALAFSTSASGAAQEVARVSKIETLLTAMRRHDRRTFGVVGGDKLRFTPTFGRNEASTHLRINAFDHLLPCQADRPRVTGIDWYSVHWDCPNGSAVGDAQFSFKFDGSNLVSVEASALPPPIVVNH